ncbi:MAG: hypothetical protein KJO41_11645 [Bacteroidia bacterium]|nr:hypothetical protein [Bacteroidia bacterium]MBT8279651.1 hypothetical protein [Bacteroidia bacterium]NND25351.1 hypothetical protein [Flavobacteriaceae bacterium]NNK60302.1 hypothetical protein [Flavobacteriaceae bacterium]NNL33910.1 hypothetical protein [Flavobacteriaceae bacterium]
MKTKSLLFSIIGATLLLGSSAIKVDVCHNVDNNPHVINVALPAAAAHLLQHSGDSLGDCVEDN